MPPPLRVMIEKVCEQNGRSMNAEIVDRLEKSLEESSNFRLLMAAHYWTQGALKNQGEMIRWMAQIIETARANISSPAAVKELRALIASAQDAVDAVKIMTDEAMRPFPKKSE